MKLIFSFIADEEVGGHDGMEKYVVSKEFKELNIGFALGTFHILRKHL